MAERGREGGQPQERNGDDRGKCKCDRMNLRQRQFCKYPRPESEAGHCVCVCVCAYVIRKHECHRELFKETTH